MIESIDRLLAKAETHQQALEIIANKIKDLKISIETELDDLEDKIYYTRKLHLDNVVQAYDALIEVDYLHGLAKQIHYYEREEEDYEE
jgi:uncharacterized protein YjaG (DUF416 family)